MATDATSRSVADPSIPTVIEKSEFNDGEYIREVLRLDDGETEAILDATLSRLAEGLGITITRSPSPRVGTNVAHASICNSSTTFISNQTRTGSTLSRNSTSTGITSRSSNEAIHDSDSRKVDARRSISFAEYEKLIHDAEAQLLLTAGIAPPPIPTTKSAPSLFSVSTRKSYQSIKSNFRNKFKLRKNKGAQEEINPCVCCRDEFKGANALHVLPCGHNYCDTCIRVLINQAATDEAKMPPRCCSRPIPAHIAKVVLSKEDQQIFMRSVLQFSTPWEDRIFCPNSSCGEFIPKREKIDPKHPFEVVCPQCDSRACSTCKRAAHALGQDCPMDWELDAVLQMGEKSGWKRCYKCRNLVELTQGCSHITCRCKAQFCYICGAVWDPTVGCPNYCSGEEELERRRVEEEAHTLSLEAEKVAREEADKVEAAARREAEQRTLESHELNEIKIRHFGERDRFCAFERKMKWLMWTRHGQAKLDVLDKYTEMQNKMHERHTRTANHLEDRQVGAEMELRASLQQAEKSVRIRLRHMEAYCDGLGRAANGPPRVITERDLRELGQQYNVRDDLERLHQSKINVMRDKQAKQMEQLLMRQEDEASKLAAKQDAELDALEESFIADEREFAQLFQGRRERLQRRWEIDGEVERKKLESDSGLRFAPISIPDWPEAIEKKDSVLESVTE